MIILLDNTPNQPSKFRTKNLFEISDVTCAACNKNNQIKVKTSVLRSSLCGYIDAYLFVKGTITTVRRGADQATRQADERDKKLIFKNCARFTDCINEINSTQVDVTKNLDFVMLMYNLIECNNNYSKTSGSLWEYYRDEPNDTFTDSKSFRSMVKITGKPPDDSNAKDVELAVPLKYLNNFWRTLEIPLINSSLILF